MTNTVTLSPEDASHLRILVVEDNPGDVVLIRELLASANVTDQITFHHVESLEQALRALLKERFDLILLDLSLPDSLGLESIRTIRQEALELPIIVLTGADDLELGIKSIQAGAQDYLQKGHVDGGLLYRTILITCERFQSLKTSEKLKKNPDLDISMDTLLECEGWRSVKVWLDQAIGKARRDGQQIGVLNVHYETETQPSNGDLAQWIFQVSGRLRRMFRQTDLVTHLYAGQFALVLSNLKNAQDLARAARKIIQEFKDVQNISSVSINIGISVYPSDGGTSEKLIQNVHLALQRARELGTNRYHFSSAQMNTEALAGDTLEKRISAGLKHEEFLLHYQPLVNFRNQSIMGVQGFARWQHPTIGLLHARNFIPMSESRTIIADLDRSIIRKGLSEYHRLESLVRDPLQLCLHVSHRFLSIPDMKSWLIELSSEYQMNLENLTFVLPESVLEKTHSHHPDILKNLLDTGIKIALDRFGDGESSLKLIKSLPFQFVKLDRSLIHRALAGGKNLSVTAALVHTIHGFSSLAAADRIESEEMVYLLQKMDFDLAQGRFFYEAEPFQRTSDALWRSSMKSPV